MNIRSFGRKAVSCAASAAIAASVCVVAPGAAMADGEAASVEGYITAASYRAAEPTPEILGLSNVATNTAFSDLGVLDWETPYFYIFGTDRNSNPNPYMVNAVNGATPAMVVDATRSGGPTASLKGYDTPANSKVVWDLLPDVILGNQDGVNYNSASYSTAAAEANNVPEYYVYGWEDGSESDEGVKYDSTNIYTMIDTMYDLAHAAEWAVEETGKQLRYGSAADIAADFESYVKGTQGYVLSRLEAEGKEQKTVVNIAGYDPRTQTALGVLTGVAEGTAAANRYLEATQFVAVNYSDDAPNKTGVSAGSDKITTYATLTLDELRDVDLIMVGGQAGTTATDETLYEIEDIVNALPTDLQDKCYYAEGSNGSCYGVVMNSVENAQNIGRILGCLYPEYVDQSDWIAYYYQHFYHIKSSSLDDTIDNAMDGVRNYNAVGTSRASWTAADVADYTESSVSTKLAAGNKYLTTASLSGAAATYLVPSDNVKIDDSIVLIDVAPLVSAIDAAQASRNAVTVSDDASALAPGTTYVSTAVAKAMDDALVAANEVRQSAKTEAAVTAAFEAINKAKETFEAAKQVVPGTPATDDDQNAGDDQNPDDATVDSGITMYRLYNPNSGEHFYTDSTVERDAVIAAGWDDEGIGWTAPSTGIKVYRLYNSIGGEHHYTTSELERDALVEAGWIWEEGGWYSDENETVPLFRAYNPNAFANNHNYTTSEVEHLYLLSLGWLDEGIGWHGIG